LGADKIQLSQSDMSHLPARWNALAVVLALATMVGCQGLSTGKPNAQGSQNPLPGLLSAAPASISFGNVQVGTNQSQSDTLSNTGGTSLTITQAAVTGTGFSTTGLNLPLTLGPGQSTTFSIVFNPQSAGSASGNLALTNDGSTSPLNIALSGTAVTTGSLTGNPTSFSFGNVQVGGNQTQTETLKNSGGKNLTISQATASGAGFSYTGLSLPLTLSPNQTTTFGVVFAPTTAGASNGRISITISGSSTSLDIALSGTGVTPATLTATPGSLTFTNVQVGQNQTQTETVQNTGGSNGTISLATVTGAGFSISGLSMPVTLTPGQSVTFNVVFAPQSAGSASGNVALINDGSISPLNIALSGTAVTQGTLTANPASFSFGSVQVGSNQSQTESLRNSGGESVTISQATASGTAFSISGITTPVTLTPGQSTSFTVTFAPQSAGDFTGSVAITSNASNPNLTIPLSGSGTVQAQGQLSVTPATINVGSVTVGTSGTQTATLSATGASVTVSSVSLSGTNASEFSISGLSFPVTVTTSQPVTFTVTFTPGATGAATASASFTSTASNSPTPATLAGTGTAAPVHSVALSWTASTSSGVTGYNVYRSVYQMNSCGSYSNIGSTPSSTTTYTDSVVADGTTYCYSTTAVDGSGESGYSNITQAKIPAP
jgi:hypothetical protein